MRIAQVSPLTESVPPANYGGTERVVAILTERLASRGHDVTLFASGDSTTSARLHPGAPRALRNDHLHHSIARHIQLIEAVAAQAHEFDVIHWHTHLLHHPIAHRLEVPSVSTVHDRLDPAPFVDFHRTFHEAPLVSISDRQRRPVPQANWVATIHHGLPPEDHLWESEVGDYLLFLGRLDPEKGVDDAIAIARRSGVPLRLAGWVKPEFREYYDSVVQPAVDEGVAEFLGEVTEEEKQRLLRHALALIFPIKWPEPFGLVMIEAMAAGTPIIAYRQGAAPEVIDHGATGYLVNDPAEGGRKVEAAAALDRHEVRLTFERRFAADRMVDQYERVYDELTRHRRVPPRHATPSLPQSTSNASDDGSPVPW